MRGLSLPCTNMQVLSWIKFLDGSICCSKTCTDDAFPDVHAASSLGSNGVVRWVLITSQMVLLLFFSEDVGSVFSEKEFQISFCLTTDVFLLVSVYFKLALVQRRWQHFWIMFTCHAYFLIGMIQHCPRVWGSHASRSDLFRFLDFLDALQTYYSEIGAKFFRHILLKIREPLFIFIPVKLGLSNVLALYPIISLTCCQ